jgi:hypothetical protein
VSRSGRAAQQLAPATRIKSMERREVSSSPGVRT